MFEKSSAGNRSSFAWVVLQIWELRRSVQHYRFGQICIQMLGCALPDDRRPHPDLKPLLASRARSQTPARTTQSHTAGPTATAHQLPRKAFESELKHRSCGTDLLTTMCFWSGFLGRRGRQYTELAPSNPSPIVHAFCASCCIVDLLKNVARIVEK